MSSELMERLVLEVVELRRRLAALERGEGLTTSGADARYLRLAGGTISGGLNVGAATGAAGGEIRASASISGTDGTFTGGLNVGSATGAGTGEIKYTGDIKPVRGGTTYTGYVYVPLVNPVVVYNGSAVSVGSYVIDTSAYGLPAGITAACIRLLGKWSSANDTYYSDVRHPSSSMSQVGIRAYAANIYADAAGIVACDNNGDFTFRVGGANTTASYLIINGYFI